MAEEEVAAEAAPKGGKGKLFLIIGIVLVLVVAGVVGALLMSGGDEKKSGDGADDEESEEEEIEMAPVYEQIELDQFIVNLGAGARYLRTTMKLEYDENVFNKIEKAEKARLEKLAAKNAESGEAAAGHEKKESKDDAPGVFGRRKAVVRDAIIELLSAKKASELLSPDGKGLVKKELVGKINEALGVEEPLVTNVYFVDFIIQ